MTAPHDRSALMSFFYQNLFPSSLILRWLRYVKTREFSFTLHNDVYVRYLSFSNSREFASRLARDVPAKIDIGAVYAHRPAVSSAVGNAPFLKELVFDVDLTDYRRACCAGKELCDKCLPLIKCAVEVLKHILEEELGFCSALFVFSGGRGVHCWVSGSVAVLLTSLDRANIVRHIASKAKRQSDPAILAILEKYSYFVDLQNLEVEKTPANLFRLLYPRLDEAVTRQQKHLLKSPFCVHPRSSRICVPLDPAGLESLGLGDIPTLQDAYLDPSVLRPYLLFFERYVEMLHPGPEPPSGTQA